MQNVWDWYENERGMLCWVDGQNQYQVQSRVRVRKTSSDLSGSIKIWCCSQYIDNDKQDLEHSLKTFLDPTALER